MQQNMLNIFFYIPSASLCLSLRETALLLPRQHQAATNDVAILISKVLQLGLKF